MLLCFLLRPSGLSLSLLHTFLHHHNSYKDTYAQYGKHKYTIGAIKHSHPLDFPNQSYSSLTCVPAPSPRKGLVSLSNSSCARGMQLHLHSMVRLRIEWWHHKAIDKSHWIDGRAYIKERSYTLMPKRLRHRGYMTQGSLHQQGSLSEIHKTDWCSMYQGTLMLS